MTSYDDQPAFPRPEDMPAVGSPADLTQIWKTLMEPLGFAKRSLWLYFLAPGGHATPIILDISDIPLMPDQASLDSLMDICAHVLTEEVPGGSVAFLLTQPGRTRLTMAEADWASGLARAAGRSGVPTWPVHRANDIELCVIAPDDLPATG